MFELEMIGKRLENERKRLGMKAVEVYKSLDIAQTTYKSYETANAIFLPAYLQNYGI